MTDTIDLRKGASINLSKTSTSVRYRIGLGWGKPNGASVDLDVSAFLCKNNANGDPELASPATNLVFYNNKRSPTEAVIYGDIFPQGFVPPQDILNDHKVVVAPAGVPLPADLIVEAVDNRSGDGDGDDEYITVDVSKIPPDIDQIIFALTSFVDQGEKKYTFGEIRSAYIRCVDANAFHADPNVAPVAKFELTDDYGGDTAMQFGSLYRTEAGDWRFKALGIGAVAELQDFLALLAPGVGTKTA